MFDAVTLTNSIFQEPWWLETVAPGKWGAVEIRRGGEIAARLPYLLKRRMGLTIVSQPPLTPTLGPWLRPSQAKYTNQLMEQKDLMDELIAGLPQFDLFAQNFSPEVTNWLPFYWHGYRSEAGCTYRIEDLSDLDKVWDDFRENVRRNIRKAEKAVSVKEDLPVKDFMNLLRMTFVRQGLKCHYRDDVVSRVFDECARRCCGRSYYAEDPSGRVHAAIFLLWDERCTYYLMSGGDPTLRDSGATSLLIWRGIRHAASVSRMFDFEGSMLEPVERFVRNFGARQVPYLTIRKSNARARVFELGRELGSALLKRWQARR